ncbi:2-octaprenyl-6-methoxyphenol hydroxylase [invertebrate metagenome]|uniref:2-octaprenyl-6-methoxyphenol hydroxylase n=1 Tax=invertebrate metagenome TaxID=1711999 RepID=A0A2H9T7C4_9ZZZZ
MEKQHWDILIVGAGLVGASLAYALSPLTCTHQLSVALVEPNDISVPRHRPASFDARSSALSYGTCQIYESLHLWQSLQSFATPIKQVHVSDSGHFGITRLRHRDENVPALGYVVENHRLGDLLLKHLQNLSHHKRLSLINPGKVTEILPTDKRMSVTLDSKGLASQCSASLVILADGGHSGLMEQLGITRNTRPYRQHAIIANIQTSHPGNGTAYERFTPKGTVALLPSGISRYGLVWTISSENTDSILQWSPERFLAELQNIFGFRAGRFIRLGARHHYPLSLTLANEQVRPGLVVLGNAAHTLHPVAGQGYNLSLRDTMTLVDTIKTAVHQGRSPGELRLLQDYQRLREPDQRRVIRFCDMLVNTFNNQKNYSIIARNFGLTALDNSNALKSHFARLAMGL